MSIKAQNEWQPCCDLLDETRGVCAIHGRYGDQVAKVLKSDADADIELTQTALEACGYRVHLRERAGTRWVTACKGLQVQYTHWHPLTNIHQAMQLLIDAPGESVNCLNLMVAPGAVQCWKGSKTWASEYMRVESAQDLINAQCRAIVTACASLKGVR